MWMNMISRGCERALQLVAEKLSSMSMMSIVSLSGNGCADKKPTAINWSEGRSKSIVAEAVIPGRVVEIMLKTTVTSLVKLDLDKSPIGSAIAGALGGFNAHTANVITAVFLATYQDPIQNIESSNCITLMNAIKSRYLVAKCIGTLENGCSTRLGGGGEMGAAKRIDGKVRSFVENRAFRWRGEVWWPSRASWRQNALEPKKRF